MSPEQHAPLLTIAVPNYNGSENLHRALMSCREVDLPPEQVEILLVDNASTDTSVELATKLRVFLPNLRIEVNEANLGRVENWNRALELARGRYLMFLFTNDTLCPSPGLAEKVHMMRELQAGLLTSPYWRVEGETTCLTSTSDNYGPTETQERVWLNLRQAILPFAPLQRLVYDLLIIRARSLSFNTSMPIAADQLFSFQVALNTPVMIQAATPHFSWHATNQRFHSSITIEQVVRADLDVIERVQPHVGRAIGRAEYCAHLLLRVLRNRMLGASGFKASGERQAVALLVRRVGLGLPLMLLIVLKELILSVGRVVQRRVSRTLYLPS